MSVVPASVVGVIAAHALAACGDDDAPGVVGPPRDAGVVDAQPGRRPLLEPQVTPNPFWHIERPADSARWWMVSPEGARTFVLGVDSVLRDEACNGMTAFLQRPDAAALEWSRLKDVFHFNAAGAFGKLDVAGAPYSVFVDIAPRGDDRALKDGDGAVLRNGLAGAKIGDPYNPAFVADVAAALHETVESLAPDKRLQVVYLGQENGIFDIASASGGVRDFRKWIWSDCPATSTKQRPKCAPHALQRALRNRYADIGALNRAWTSVYPSFEAITKPPATCSATCSEDLLRFVREDLLALWVNLIATQARAYAPKHVIASPRLALGSAKTFHFFTPSDVWLDDGTSIGTYDPYPLLSKFDLVAINVFTASATYEEPWLGDGLRKLHDESLLPAIVSEMGTQVTIAGWANGEPEPGPTTVASQAERGARYASQLGQLSALPDVVGVVWQGWSDQYVPTDATRQRNVGLVQCSDSTQGFVAGAAWTELVAPISSSNLAATKIE